jgi:hypothetical protein
MSKHSIDYFELEKKINKKSYRLSDVQDRIVRLGFDVVRFKDSDNGADLWQIQSSDDGDYIVSLYEDTNENVKTASANSNWEVTNLNGNLQFFYKGDPIVRTAASSLGLSSEDISALSKNLPKKLAENKKLVNLLLNQADLSLKEKILTKYPELA